MSNNILKIFIVLLCFPSFLSAQKVRMKYGQKMFNKREYGVALTYFEDVAGNKESNPEAFKMAALCNMRLGQYKEAESWAIKLGTQKTLLPEYLELYFKTLVDNGKYDQAMEVLRKYKSKGFKGTLLDAFVVDPKFWNKNTFLKGEYELTKLNFCTKREELAPALKGDELFFAKLNRGNQKKSFFDNSESIDLSFVTVDKDFNTPGKSKSFSNANEAFKDSYISFSEDRKTILLVKVDNKNKKKNLLIGNNGKIEMKDLVEFEHGSNKYSVGRACLSPDGSKLVFSSDMPGAIGEVDLWMCLKGKNGKWKKPVNLGEQINTKYYEAMPCFIDSNTLCFASDGLPGYGRFDLYRSEWKEGKFQAPENMGKPLNTEANEIGISYSKERNTYLFATDRNGNYDIFKFRKIEKEPEVLSLNKKDESDDQNTIIASDKQKTNREEITPKSVKKKEKSRNNHFEPIVKQSNHKPDTKNEVNPSSFYSVQLMAIVDSEAHAKEYFLRRLKEYPGKYMVVLEEGWIKFRCGRFVSSKEALEFGTRKGFKKIYVVQMLEENISEILLIK